MRERETVPEPWAGRHSLGRYDATYAAIGPAALWSARAAYRPSLHRHAEFVRRRHALAYAVDEARLAGRRGDRGAPPGADDLHPLHSGAASRRPAGELAALLPALGRADLGADRQAAAGVGAAAGPARAAGRDHRQAPLFAIQRAGLAYAVARARH